MREQAATVMWNLMGEGDRTAPAAPQGEGVRTRHPPMAAGRLRGAHARSAAPIQGP